MATEQNHRRLTDYRLLGRSGLRVSPFCLGTMTFGTEWGWGAPEESAFALLDRYIEAGGNFIDTADLYTQGSSERMVGKYVAERKLRDRLVVATKFSFGAEPGNPNSGGNGRKNMVRALEGSLKRLQTDYIDLYWVHAWDTLTPVEEVMRALDDLVTSGKVRYLGLSDVPAWYFARAQTLAEWRGFERIVGLQLEYSLVERNIEREHVPAALELGAGLCPWSPLGSGLLTGKYQRAEAHSAAGEGRLALTQKSGNPAFEKLLTERNWAIVDAVLQVSRDTGRTPAQVALAWLAEQPAVTSILVGATKLSQLDDNLAALDAPLPPEARAKLDLVSRPESIHPYLFFEPEMRGMLTAGTSVRRLGSRS